jgi:hypothetical protein
MAIEKWDFDRSNSRNRGKTRNPHSGARDSIPSLETQPQYCNTNKMGTWQRKNLLDLEAVSLYRGDHGGQKGDQDRMLS